MLISKLIKYFCLLIRIMMGILIFKNLYLMYVSMLIIDLFQLYLYFYYF
jgi:hypothetical protein